MIRKCKTESSLTRRENIISTQLLKAKATVWVLVLQWLFIANSLSFGLSLHHDTTGGVHFGLAEAKEDNDANETNELESYLEHLGESGLEKRSANDSSDTQIFTSLILHSRIADVTPIVTICEVILPIAVDPPRTLILTFSQLPQPPPSSLI